MNADDITQIKIGGHRFGIIGLQSILAEVAERCAGQSDEEIRGELLNNHKNLQ